MIGFYHTVWPEILTGIILYNFLMKIPMMVFYLKSRKINYACELCTSYHRFSKSSPVVLGAITSTKAYGPQFLRETNTDSDPYAVRRLQSLDTSLEEFRPLLLSLFIVMDGSSIRYTITGLRCYSSREAYKF